MPSGTMAQQIALRIQARRRNCRNIAIHEQSHLVVSENNALAMLSGLQPIAVGARESLFGVDDLEEIHDPLAAVLLELPERNLGGALRPWGEVEAICAWAHERGIAAHLDGARLWECEPFYNRSVAELAEPFDTVYVSFYKILNAVAGAALAGPKVIIDEARAWQWRHGGRLVQQFPMIVSAREGLARYLPRIPLYCERAREIAAIFAAMEDVIVTPHPPHTNMFHVYVRRDRERLMKSAKEIQEQHGIRFFPVWNATEIPGYSMAELTCAEGSLEIADGEIRDLFGRFLQT